MSDRSCGCLMYSPREFLDLKEAGWRSNAPTRRQWHGYRGCTVIVFEFGPSFTHVKGDDCAVSFSLQPFFSVMYL